MHCQYIMDSIKKSILIFINFWIILSSTYKNSIINSENNKNLNLKLLNLLD